MWTLNLKKLSNSHDCLDCVFKKCCPTFSKKYFVNCEMVIPYKIYIWKDIHKITIVKCEPKKLKSNSHACLDFVLKIFCPTFSKKDFVNCEPSSKTRKCHAYHDCVSKIVVLPFRKNILWTVNCYVIQDLHLKRKFTKSQLWTVNVK